MTQKELNIGVVAPSSAVSSVELALGVARLRDAGFNVRVHPQCRKRHRFYAGKDEARAEALYEMAMDPTIDVIWSARGGYGSMRLLTLLDQLTAEGGLPAQKLYVGYSDSFALHEYVRNHWEWATLHAPMPGVREFAALTDEELGAIAGCVRRVPEIHPGGSKRLKFLGEAPEAPIEGELIGGNLSVWASLIGSRHAPKTKGRILFLEDVGEALYRIDRMLEQFMNAGIFEKARGVVLGTFHQCDDVVARVLKEAPAPRNLQRALESPSDAELEPLRPKLQPTSILAEMFAEVNARFDIPVAFGLPVGHGPGHAPLPLGAPYRLDPQGYLELLDWSWWREETTPRKRGILR